MESAVKVLEGFTSGRQRARRRSALAVLLVAILALLVSGSTETQAVELFELRLSDPLVSAQVSNRQSVSVAPNDNFASPAPLELSGVSGSIVGATSEPGEPAHGPCFRAYRSIWYSWVAPKAGLLTLSANSTSGIPCVAAYTGNSMNSLRLRTDRFAHVPTSFKVESGTTYFIAVDGNANVVQLSGSFEAAPDNDNLIDAIPLQIGDNVGTTTASTREPGEANHLLSSWADLSAGSAWYRWIAPRRGTLRFQFDPEFQKVSQHTLCAYQAETNEPRHSQLQEVLIEEEFGTFVQKRQCHAVSSDKTQLKVEAGREYWLAIVNINQQGPFTMRATFEDYVPPPPPPSPLDCPPTFSGAPFDNFSARAQIEGEAFRVCSRNFPATRQAWDYPDKARNSIWFAWRAPKSGRLQLSTKGNDESESRGPLDVVLSIFKENESLSPYEPSLGLIAWNDDWVPSRRESAIVEEVEEGVDYAIMVGTRRNQGGVIELAGRVLEDEEKPTLAGPEPKIVAGPANLVPIPRAAAEARFLFRVVDGNGYECALDNAPWQTCSSGVKFDEVPLGGHTFKLRETRSGVSSVVERTWIFAPRSVQIVAGPMRTSSRRARFSIRHFQGASLSCRLNGRQLDSCGANLAIQGLKPGRHRLVVNQIFAEVESRSSWSWKVIDRVRKAKALR